MPRQNVWKIYFNPFDDQGLYTGWVDVTADVIFDQMGSIKTNIDNTEFDIGIFKNSAFQIAMKNESGNYSDVDNVKSIFHFRRDGTQVMVTWQIEQDDGPTAGDAIAGDAWLSTETEIFKGILNDDGTFQDIDSNAISFTVVGRETLFDNGLYVDGSVSNGDLFSAAIAAILNQSVVTGLLTVSPSNIACGTDQTIDDATQLSGLTITEAMTQILFASNSVLRIVNDSIIVSARTPSVSVQCNFYGQGSSAGAENIQSIKNITNGSAKVFNFILWTSTTTSVQNDTSVATYGVQKKEIDFAFTTDTGKRTAILQSLVTEFGLPEQEFDLSSPISWANVSLQLLDKISIDYPVVYVPNDNPPAICGVAICGSWWTPKALWDFTIDPLDVYKIINRTVNLKESIVTFRMRKVS